MCDDRNYRGNYKNKLIWINIFFSIVNKNVRVNYINLKLNILNIDLI